MLLVGLTGVGSRHHALDGTEIPEGKGQFWGCPPIYKHWETGAVDAKAAEPIEMPFGD